MSDTPSGRIVAAAQQPIEIMDASARVMKLRTLGVLDQVRLLRAIGPDQSRNEPYVMLVQAAASVCEIDGVPVPFPANERQIDAAIARLGDEGFAAISVHMRKAVEAVEAAAAAAAQ
jgi:hypothetical protein